MTRISPRELHDSHRWIHLDEIRLLPGNPNLGNEESLSASLSTFGWIDGIIIHSGTVLAGNHRVEAARAAGEEGLPGYDLSRFDMNEAKRLALALTHNFTSRAGVDDPELLAAAAAAVAELGDPAPYQLAVSRRARTKQDDGDTVQERRDGFAAAAFRQLVLVFGASDYAEVLELFDAHRAETESNAAVLARILGVPHD